MLMSGIAVVAHVIRDREQFERRERPENDVDLVALDQFLGLGLGAGRIAAGVGRDHLDLATRERIRLFLHEHRQALLHLDAALGERSGLDG